MWVKEDLSEMWKQIRSLQQQKLPDDTHGKILPLHIIYIFQHLPFFNIEKYII